MRCRQTCQAGFLRSHTDTSKRSNWLTHMHDACCMLHAASFKLQHEPKYTRRNRRDGTDDLIAQLAPSSNAPNDMLLRALSQIHSQALPYRVAHLMNLLHHISAHPYRQTAPHLTPPTSHLTPTPKNPTLSLT